MYKFKIYAVTHRRRITTLDASNAFESPSNTAIMTGGVSVRDVDVSDFCNPELSLREE
jgi:hypothetical protein